MDGRCVEREFQERLDRLENVALISVKDDRVGALRKLGRSHYARFLMPLHVELLKLQSYVKEKQLKVVVLFEGRDAAGKGGTIKRFIEHMNPRGCRVVALEKPSVKERSQWYFQRYANHLPAAGEIVLFDRSWYNRAMVERVMGFCSDDEVREFLRAVPEARATIYDFPEVIPLSHRRIEAAGLGDRVDLVAGDFYTDSALPAGADLAWVSAIVHQNSREQNRALFAKVHSALARGGQLMVRDIVMDDAHTSPPAGALFAVNMLVRTEAGDTFSFAELCEDLASVGFGDSILIRGARDMDSVLRAPKP